MCHVEATPSNGYKTTDGYILLAPASDKLFVTFAETVGRPELAEDPRFCNGAARLKNRTELDAIIGSIISTKSSDEWYEIMRKAGLPASPIVTPRYAFRKAYDEGSPIVTTVEHYNRGKMPVIGTVCGLSRTPGFVDRRAPCLGENTAEVLRSIGMEDEQIASLEAKGVIKCFRPDEH